MTEEEIAALNHTRVMKKRKTQFDDYMNIIYKMLRNKLKPEVIVGYIVKIGCTGNIDSLKDYICVFAKNNFNRKFRMDWTYKLSYPNDVLVIISN